MKESKTLRTALLTVSGALAAGWLVACGDDAATTDTTPETTETTQTTEHEGTNENDGTIELPSPDVDVPEVTLTPSP